jgi:hypothetical protein
MPRKPYPVKKAGAFLEQWIEQRVPKGSDEAPITVAAAVAFLVQKGIKTHRTTLYSKGLNGLIVEGARRQREADGGGRRSEERRESEAILDRMREHNALLEKRNRALLGEIATMVFNARRCNVSEEELRRPMTPPDRSQSRAGRHAESGKRR